MMQATKFFLFGLVALTFASTGTFANMTDDEGYNVGTVSMASDRMLVFRLNIRTFNFKTWKPQTPKRVEIAVPVGGPSYPAMLSLAGAVAPGETKPLPPWTGFIGLIKMESDGTVVYYSRFVATGGGGDSIFESVLPPGNELGKNYIQHVGGLAPGEVKPVSPWPETVGVANMLPDGTIRLYLRSQTASGIIAETVVDYKPGDPMYREVMDHIGGIKPGEEKPIPPWPTSKGERKEDRAQSGN